MLPVFIILSLFAATPVFAKATPEAVIEVPSSSIVRSAPRPQPRLSAEQLELAQTKGIIAFNRGNYSEARRLFTQVRAQDSKNSLPLEYLARIAEIGEDYREAVLLLKQAQKLSPRERRGQIDFYIGDLLMKMRHEGLAEQYFMSALRQGAFPIQSLYYLGFSSYRQEEWREAEEHFHEAEALIEHARANKESVDPHIEQPLHYYLGEIYARLGYPRYALYELYSGAKGDIRDVKKAAWALEEQLDQGSRRLSVGLTGLYDSNVIETANGTPSTPTGISKEGGTGVTAMLNFAAQTSPSRKWSYGMEYNLYYTRYTREDLGQFDTLSNLPALWLSWWNSRNTEFRLRYDYNHTMLDRNSLDIFLQSHGPTASWSYFWDRRRQLDASYTYRRNSYPDDLATGVDQRSGEQHTVMLRGSFAAPNPDFQPYAQYLGDYNNTEGTTYYALTHSLELGTGYQLGVLLRANFALSYGFAKFPRASVERHDHLRSVKFGVTMPVADTIIALLDGSFSDNLSSFPAAFSYRRFQVSLGAVYTLPF